MYNTKFDKTGKILSISALMICKILLNPGVLQAQTYWKPVEGHIMTSWAEEVSPDNVLAEYPRPMMVRGNWQSLNGLWEYAVRAKDESCPEGFDGNILVPFPVESALSGVKKDVGENRRLWYRHKFHVPGKWAGRRILLHFGAVDWETTVWVNGREAGYHRGGYDPFTLDITDVLDDNGTQEIILSVWDPTDSGYQPRGKQVSEPKGIWYTAVTGIWQTVWLEPVPEIYIKSLKITPDIDKEEVRITVTCSDGAKGYSIEAEAKDGQFTKGKTGGNAEQEIIMPIEKPKLWSPDSPFLYDLKVTLKDGQGKKVDVVESYFGMRKVALDKDKNGIKRIFLNNKELFQFGPLDQGWWPDGLYTAPSDEALRYDLEVIKKLGFNMLRKHVKVEPQRLYYWCDRLGLLVWQDMPNGDRHIKPDEPDIRRSEESDGQYMTELKNIIDALKNHPCIVMWVPFNEGWGQFDTARINGWIKEYDQTRLVNNTSGWADRGVGDVNDIHKYPGPAAPPVEADRAIVLGEFGGLGLPVKGHSWIKDKGWGYRTYKSNEELTENYLRLLRELKPLIAGGLSAAVYTQTTDVESESNGLLTYDRKIVKMDAEKVAKANKSVIK